MEITLQRMEEREGHLFILHILHIRTLLPPTDLKAMTMTRAKMAPCMNRWLMQPGSTAELCDKATR